MSVTPSPSDVVDSKPINMLEYVTAVKLADV